MSELFVISDTHFGHENVLKFEHEGKPLRPFSSLEEMHLTMLERWNAQVMPNDKVYHLGDVAWNKESLKILGLMNGKKRLVRGNHDRFKLNVYREYFDEIYGVRQIDGIWLTHVPMHESCIVEPRTKLNVHGHLHARRIDHPKYFNASVECIAYAPYPFEELRKLAAMEKTI